MFLNEHKGWYGNFSGAGKTSAITYKALINQQNKLTKKHHFNPYKIEPFDPEVQKEILKQKEDNIDIFKLDNIDQPVLTKSSSSSLITAKRNQKENSKRYYYHNKHRNQKRTTRHEYIPGCTDYYPKYTLTLSRSVSGAAWNTLTGRKELIKKDSTNSKFYLEKESILSTKAGKSFVDMSKQTSRPETGKKYMHSQWQFTPSITKGNRPLSSKLSFSGKYYTEQENFATIELSSNYNDDKGISSMKNINTNNIKHKHKQNMRPFTANIHNKHLKQSESSPLLINDTPTGTMLLSSFTSQSIPQEKQQISTQTEDSYEQHKQQYLKLYKKTPKTPITHSKTQTQVKSTIKTKRKFIKAPDFQKTISREHIAMLNDKKKALISFSLPNYKQVRERPLSMVVYDRKNYSKPKSKAFQGVDYSFNYDPDKMICKVNNHKRVQTPNLSLTKSRPDDVNDPLPSYMKQIFNRNSCYQTTALSLKMNNFANGVYLQPSNENWHKKTFNKIINLNLLNNKEFVKTFIKNQKQFAKGKDTIAKSFKFYKKNYNDLLKDEMMSRFDNVTFKTKTRHQFLNPKEVEKFIVEK